jgi:hypothetical protein
MPFYLPDNYTKTHVTFKAVLAHYCSSYAVFAGEVEIYMPIIDLHFMQFGQKCVSQTSAMTSLYPNYFSK